MPKFGRKSTELRQYLCKDLRRLVDEVIKTYDFSIVESFRSKEDQEVAYINGFSRAHFGESAHNYNPSFAVDCYPYPIPRKEIQGVIVIDDYSEEWDKMIAAFKTAAKKLNIELVCGADYKMFRDAPHFEISGWKDKIKEI